MAGGAALIRHTNEAALARSDVLPVERFGGIVKQLDMISGMRKIAPNHIKAKLATDRGDVPGWVLITLMTAGLVIIIWGVAGPALAAVFQQAIDRVTGF